MPQRHQRNEGFWAATFINSWTRHVSSRGIPGARTETNLTAIPCSSAPRTSTPQLHLDEVYPLSSSRADQGVQCFLCNVYESWIVHLLRVTVCSLGVRGFSENGCTRFETWPRRDLVLYELTGVLCQFCPSIFVSRSQCTLFFHQDACQTDDFFTDNECC